MKLMMLLMNWRVILMNNKGRLEEIKKIRELPNKLTNPDVTEYYVKNPIKSLEVLKASHVEFLIKQAERVEELKKLLSISDEFDNHIKNTDVINSRYYREKALALYLDNKRYREALEFYTEEKTYNFDLIHDEHGTLIDSEIMDDT